MTVYDRWHKTHPPEDAQPCRCGRGRNKLYPTKAHGVGLRWQVRWRDEQGRQPKRNFGERYGDDPERHAEAFDADVNARLDAGTYVDPELGQITLEQYARQWRGDHVAEPSTLETLDKHLAHIYDVARTERTKRAAGSSPIGHRKLSELAKSPSAMRGWIKSLEAKGLSAAYIGQIGTTLASILNVAVEDGRISRNPMHAKAVKLPAVPEHRPRPWTVQMVEAARGEVHRRHESGGIVDLGAAAGLRVSEVFGFAEEDIEFLGADRKIHVRRQIKRIRNADGDYVLVFGLPKYGKQREVPLSDTLAIRLAEQIKAREPAEVELPWERADGPLRTYRLLFVKADGLPWYRQAFEHTWTAARQIAGAPPPPDENGRFHGLRHTFASMQLAGGADVRKLAAWLGHTDPGFTLRTYTHLMPDIADVGRRAVDAFFAVPARRQSALDVPSGGNP